MNTNEIIALALLQYGPVLARALTEILSKKDEPTLEEWDKIFTLAEKTYDQYVNPTPT